MVAIHDPARPRRQLLLPSGPLLHGERRKVRAPEVFVQFDHRQPSDATQLDGRGRLSSPAAAENDDALHLVMIGAPTLRWQRHHAGKTSIAAATSRLTIGNRTLESNRSGENYCEGRRWNAADGVSGFRG